ncbi:DEAD/DEAH box helicase [bacterium]|nr:DEAD/DEAH box helicase [bacterium]
MILRPYQQATKDAVYDHLRSRRDNPCVVIPTGGGKTPVIAEICKEAVTRRNWRVLILSHSRELLQQTADKLQAICPEVEFGVFCAGLGQRDTRQPVILASIQSVHSRACELGRFDLIIIDEAHHIPPEGDGMYRKFLAEVRLINPHARVVGFTATPFRLKTGPICTPAGILNAICYEIGVRELIAGGYLCPLFTSESDTTFDTTSIRVQSGEFASGELENLMDDNVLVREACEELVRKTSGRRSVLIFASGVQHAQHIVEVLRADHGVECGFVDGSTPIAERDATIACFKSRELKYLVNVGVLTTGFDAPCVDAVVLLRPTMSLGLYYQMVGRGFRIDPRKLDCLVLDFGGNVRRHGPVDSIRVEEPVVRQEGTAPVKPCPQCQAFVSAGFAICPHCGFLFDPPERQRHEARASEDAVLSRVYTRTRYRVENVRYRAYTKVGAGPNDPPTLRVAYWAPEIDDYIVEWICFEHQGYARQKAVEWWTQRSAAPVPNSVDQALAIIHEHEIAAAHAITVLRVQGEIFPKIVGYELGPLPTGRPFSGMPYPSQISDLGQTVDFVNEQPE